MTRSNRQLTQFAVDRVRGLLAEGPTPGSSRAGNTEVEVDRCESCDRPDHIVIKLFGKPILRIFLSPLNNRTPVGIMVRTGDFYDSKGRPSRTTRERLNGLLDFLCTHKVLPEGVRVFLREDGYCCIGKGNAAKVFDRSNPAVIIMSHPTDLVVN